MLSLPWIEGRCTVLLFEEWPEENPSVSGLQFPTLGKTTQGVVETNSTEAVSGLLRGGGGESWKSVFLLKVSC